MGNWKRQLEISITAASGSYKNIPFGLAGFRHSAPISQRYLAAELTTTQVDESPMSASEQDQKWRKERKKDAGIPTILEEHCECCAEYGVYGVYGVDMV